MYRAPGDVLPIDPAGYRFNTLPSLRRAAVPFAAGAPLQHCIPSALSSRHRRRQVRHRLVMRFGSLLLLASVVAPGARARSRSVFATWRSTRRTPSSCRTSSSNNTRLITSGLGRQRRIAPTVARLSPPLHLTQATDDTFFDQGVTGCRPAMPECTRSAPARGNSGLSGVGVSGGYRLRLTDFSTATRRSRATVCWCHRAP